VPAFLGACGKPSLTGVGAATLTIALTEEYRLSDLNALDSHCPRDRRVEELWPPSRNMKSCQSGSKVRRRDGADGSTASCLVGGRAPHPFRVHVSLSSRRKPFESTPASESGRLMADVRAGNRPALFARDEPGVASSPLRRHRGFTQRDPAGGSGRRCAGGDQRARARPEGQRLPRRPSRLRRPRTPFPGAPSAGPSASPFAHRLRTPVRPPRIADREVQRTGRLRSMTGGARDSRTRRG
jgi:hypothetical protein